MINSPKAKALIAIVLAIAAGLVTALGTSPQQNLGHLGWVDWLTFAGGVLASGGVTWWCQNGPYHTYIKAIVGSAGAAVTSLIVALSDNVITQAEWITAISAAVLAFAAVFQTSNLGLPGGSAWDSLVARSAVASTTPPTSVSALPEA